MKLRHIKIIVVSLVHRTMKLSLGNPGTALVAAIALFANASTWGVGDSPTPLGPQPGTPNAPLTGGSGGTTNPPVPGAFDTSFNAAPVNGAIRAIALQEDGKILIGGFFTAVQNVSCPCLARLNSDGSLDTSFVPAIEFWPHMSNQVESVIVQPDGNILVGGLFTLPGTPLAADLVRLKPDGRLDSAFQSRVLTNISQTTNFGSLLPLAGMVRQTDGKIVIAWATEIMELFYGGVPVTIRISRYNLDGTLDSTYAAPEFTEDPFSLRLPFVNQLLLLPDDSLIVMGSMPLVKFDSTGRAQPYGPVFSPVCGDRPCEQPSVTGGVSQPDGKVVIWGAFRVTGAGLCFRISPQGGVDPTFQPQTQLPTPVLSLKDGTILMKDSWWDATHPVPTDTSRLLDKDGMQISPWQGQALPADPVVAVEQTDGNILVAGGNAVIRLFGPDHTPRAPQIVQGPTSTVIPMAPAPDWTILSIRATGYPLQFQWSRNGEALPGATNSTLEVTGQYGRFAVTITNQLGRVTSSELTLVLPVLPPSLDEALNVPGWSFEAPVEHGLYSWDIGQWTVDTQTSHDGVASVVGNCANFSNDQYTSRLLTTITGPGTLSYWTSGTGYLVLQVGNYVFDYYKYDSPTAWTRREVPIPPGTNTLTWQPEAADIQTSALARLDELTWQPAPPGGPTLTFDPAEIVVPAGLEADLRISVRDLGLTHFQWYRLKQDLTLPVGVFSLPPGTEPLHPLAEFNQDTIHLSRVTETDSGYYLVTAQLDAGVTTCSGFLKLSVVNIPALQLQSPAPGQWHLVWSDAGIGMRLQQTRSLSPTDWQAVPGTELTNRFPVPLGDETLFFRLMKP